MSRLVTLLAWCCVTLAAQQDGGLNRLGLPNPPKQDVPFLIHGSQLVELDRAAATMEESKNQVRYWIPGAAAAAKTPLAAPDFLFDSGEVDPRDLELYRFEVVKGRRELLYRRKKKVVAEPYFLNLEGVEERVVRIRINASLQPGEYGITPRGQDSVYTFSVF